MGELPVVNSRRYGWIRKVQSHKAYGLASVPGIKLATPPPTDYHLAEFMPPVKDQGQLGSCTAHAGAEDREAIARQYEGKSPILSPLFLYYIERQLDGSLGDGDCGSTGETSCTALIQFGICPEPDDPYDVNAYQTAPTAQQLSDAAAWKAGAYHTISTLEDLKLCINSGYRFRMGFTVYESFEGIGGDGLMPLPGDTEAVLGGHEVLAYAYDDTATGSNWSSPGAVIIRNSWGAGWGKGGDFLVPYELMSPDSALAPDWKIQHLGPAWG